MSVVDTTSGEVVDIADRQEAERIAAGVTTAVDMFNAWGGALLDAICEAYEKRIWVALGFGSWADLVDAKGWTWKPHTSAQRVAVGEYLVDHGMSLKAIAKLTAHSKQTIRRDQVGGYESDQGVPNGTPHSYPQQEATADPEPLEGDGDDDADGPLGHDEGETTGEEASDTASGGGQEGLVTPVPPAATSHPDATTAQNEGAANPSRDVTTEPPSAATEPPAAPSTSDAGLELLDEMLTPSDDDAAVKKAWQLIRAAGQLPALFPADRFREFADADLLDSAASLADRLGRWSEAIANHRPLRVVQGGQP